MSPPLERGSLPCSFICREHSREGRNQLIYSQVCSSEGKPGAFSYLIINALNQMLSDMLTSVTLNGVGQ